MQGGKDRLGDSCSPRLGEFLDSVLKASGDPDIDEAISFLGYVIQKIWWWIARGGYWGVCNRVHTNTYPWLIPFRVTTIGGIADD